MTGGKERKGKNKKYFSIQLRLTWQRKSYGKIINDFNRFTFSPDFFGSLICD
jgi:hypothetical protein